MYRPGRYAVPERIVALAIGYTRERAKSKKCRNLASQLPAAIKDHQECVDLVQPSAHFSRHDGSFFQGEEAIRSRNMKSWSRVYSSEPVAR